MSKKMMMMMLLTLLFTCFGFRIRPMLSSPNACLIIAKVSDPIFTRLPQHLMLSFVGSIKNGTRPQTVLQRKGRGNQHVHPGARNFEHILARVLEIMDAPPQASVLKTHKLSSAWSFKII
jgi:hypothetical protein